MEWSRVVQVVVAPHSTPAETERYGERVVVAVEAVPAGASWPGFVVPWRDGDCWDSADRRG